MRIFGMVLLSLIILFLFGNSELPAQQIQNTDSPYLLDIPSITAMAGSPAHLYILSKTDGLIVFRSKRDSLQWLYTIPRIQQHVQSISADARFAFLFRDSLRLNIIDPTRFNKKPPSVKLHTLPHGAVRWKNHLYLALGSGGLGKLNLNTVYTQTPAITKVDTSIINNQYITDIGASRQQIFVLSDKQELFIFDKNQNGIHFKKKLTLPYYINRLFVVSGTLMGSDNLGAFFIIHPNGAFQNIGSIDEPVLQIKRWKNRLIIKGLSHRLWVTDKKGKLHLWKADGKAGNYFAISRGHLWLSRYNQVYRVNEEELHNYTQAHTNEIAFPGTQPVLKIQPIKDQVIPYPHALLVPIKLKTTLPIEDIQLHLKTSASNARIRGQSLLWKPDYDNVSKQYNFRIIATTSDGETASTGFNVSVEAFNSPPHFIPIRPVTIPNGHWYHLKVKASDPDATNKHLVRYLGVNLPKGASINSKTGLLQWKPDKEQIGKHRFRIIATDQYGSASYEDITIRVLGTDTKK